MIAKTWIAPPMPFRLALLSAALRRDEGALQVHVSAKA